MRDEKAKIYVQIVPDLSKVHEMTDDLNELAKALEKANDLIDRLASHGEIEVSLAVESKSPATNAGALKSTPKRSLELFERLLARNEEERP